jgi:cell wall-associated NlpC family hydrolase
MKRVLTALTLAVAGLTMSGQGLVTAAPARAGFTGAQVVNVATQYIGLPYRAKDGNPEVGFSDLGFVRYVYHAAGITLPNNLKRLLHFAPAVQRDQLQPGDLVFFKNTIRKGLSHVGIYVGNGTFIHAEYYGYGVRITSFVNDAKDGNYWPAKFKAANRPLAGSST